MRKLLALVALLLLAAGWAPAQAKNKAQQPITGFACPMGAGTADNCGQSLFFRTGTAANFQLPNCWGAGGDVNQITGTTTTYTRNPTTLNATGSQTNIVPYNSVGCETPVGSADPTTFSSPVTGPYPGTASTIAGCTYAPTGGVGGGALMTCSGGSVPHSITQFEFGATGVLPDGSGHPCIPISFVGSGLTGDYSIWNNDWVNDGNCAVSNGFPVFIKAVNTTGMRLFITDNNLDGNAQTWDTYFGSCAFGTTACSVTEAISLAFGGNTGPVFIQRNVIKNFLLRGIVWQQITGADITICNNYFSGNNWRLGSDHGELFEPHGIAGSPGFPGGQNVCFNNFVNPTGNAQLFEALWPSNFGDGAAFIKADHNVVIGNFPGNARGGTAGSMTIAAGGSHLTMTTLSGGQTIGSGLVIKSCTAAGKAGSIQGNLWTPYSGQAALRGGGYYGGSASGQAWGLDVDSSGGNLVYTVTGFIDDGSGGTSPAPAGHPGNIFRVTTAGLINIASGSTAQGTAKVTLASNPGVQLANVLPYGTGGTTGTGGVGTYTIDGSPRQNASASFGIQVPNPFDGGWSAESTITCPSQSLASGTTQSGSTGYMFLDPEVVNASYGSTTVTSPIVLTNNSIDEQSFGSTYLKSGWNQRGPIQAAAGNFPVTGFIDDGLGGGAYDGAFGTVLTVTSIPATGFFVFPHSGTTGSKVTGSGVTTTNVLAQTGGTTGRAGAYTVGVSQAVPSGTINIGAAGCSGPAVFGGNLSMSGLYTDIFWDGWNATLAGSGC